MEIVVADLDEAGAGFVEEFAGEKEAVAEIGQVGMMPSSQVSRKARPFWFLGEVFVLAVLDFAAIDEGWKLEP